MALPPKKKLVNHEEVVLEAQGCVLNNCPLLEKKNIDGKEFYNCGAKIFQADVPKELIDDELDEETNNGEQPVLLRLLMAPSNTTRYCSLKKIAYKQEEIVPNENIDDELFS